MYRRYGKRLVDLALTVPALIVLSPLSIAVALLVRLKLGSPVLFRQERGGLHGKPFCVIKFRSMTEERDEQGNLLPEEQRLTGVGRFVRSYSLDELPAFVNVLRGEMSLVGPRPLFIRYLRRYTPEQMRRHEVRPGITGLAQVSGRNALTWERKFALDLEYVENVSLWLDVKIMARTVAKIVTRDGIDQEGYVSAEEFMGSRG
jgi:sugar transferase EpsL